MPVSLSMPWKAVVLIVALAIVPAASGQPNLILGSPDEPELPDAAGDVNAAASYTGPKESVDFLAAWLEHSNDTDDITVTLKTSDAQRFAQAPPGHRLGCEVAGTITGEGGELGTLRLRWIVPENHTAVEHYVRYTVKTSAATGEGVPVVHGFAVNLTAPAEFKFSVPRVNLTKLGDQIENPSAHCMAFVSPPGASPQNFAGFSMADDVAASKASYSFRELRQTRNVAGERLDPIEEFERRNQTASPTSNSASVEQNTPFLGLAVLFVAILGAALVRRRQH